jgi:hypothetical protein
MSELFAALAHRMSMTFMPFENRQADHINRISGLTIPYRCTASFEVQPHV